MARRSVLLAVLGIELLVGAVLFKAGYLSRHPVVPPMPPLEVKAYPAPPRVSSVDLRRGDTFVKALQREGVSPKVGHDIATALRGEGVNLRKLTPRHGLAIEWTLDGQPKKLRYEPSPWLGYGGILVAQYVSDGRTLTGVGAEGPRGRYTFYDPAGRSLRKSFLKSPLQFS